MKMKFILKNLEGVFLFMDDTEENNIDGMFNNQILWQNLLTESLAIDINMAFPFNSLGIYIFWLKFTPVKRWSFWLQLISLQSIKKVYKTIIVAIKDHST